MSPRQIDSMSFWEFNACVDGFMLSKGVKKANDGHTEEQLRAMGIVGV